MGLDMYLSKKTYVKNWEHNGPTGQHKITVKKGGKTVKHIQPKRISYIVEEVAYWRKANHIHQWFVQVVQGGKDECQEAYVSVEQLRELKDICEKIVTYFDSSVTGEKEVKASFGNDWGEKTYDVDENVLADLLPTASGFFFGGTAYDHWYYQDCKNTIKMIDEAFKGAENIYPEFYYQSSW
jgi:Ni,Fe-hydrogenase I large subunit